MHQKPTSSIPPEIIYLTKPLPVSMGDAWFEIATPEHFWMIRRFDVTRMLADELITSSTSIAEIGCGNGVLQHQIESRYIREVDGVDLNDYALRLSIVNCSPRYCYNILEQREDLAGKYDLLFLYDVIEHIDDETAFIDAVLYHLKPGGHVIINVPAIGWLFSAYDHAAGHKRRYTIPMLLDIADKHHCKVRAVTYWGMPFIPLLILRKWILAAKKQSDSEILKTGFKATSKLANTLLGLLSRLEHIPQKRIGSSAMIIMQKQKE